MLSPPVSIQSDEIPIEANDVEMSCLDKVRSIASGVEYVDLDSLQATRGGKYRFIFRYCWKQIYEDGSGIGEVVVIIWTDDCKTFGRATHPSFKLPDEKSQ